MAKKDPTAVPFDEFMGKYAGAIREGHAADQHNRAGNALTSVVKGDFALGRLIFSPTELRDEVMQWWPVRLLREAARENNSEGFKRLLDWWLCTLHVAPPHGVLTPFRGTRGRPKSEETERVCAAWLASGKPPVSKLVLLLHREDYRRADVKGRKKLRDSVEANA